MADKYNASLELARKLTDRVNEAWNNESILEKVTPITSELLKYWFGDDFCSIRKNNFHEGQRQAILNTIYLHEVIGVENVIDVYEKIVPELLEIADLATLRKDKYQMPKYAIKMATGTGKTWVMHALLIWQLLNASREDEPSGRFTQNFLIVAPGLIVYDRLKDAFCGRMKEDENCRDFETSDFYRNQEIFLPPHLRDEVFSFLQNNVVTKEEGIGKKTTGEGLIALTNWHLFENQIEDDEIVDDNQLTPPEIIRELLPVRPGASAGNDLGMLDRRYLRGTELEYLSSLESLMVINDEAHHIHEVKHGGETDEVEWQRGLNQIASGVGPGFMQVDFSATPYDTITSRGTKTKNYFPHVVVDFDLSKAMRHGLVKMLLLDRRQELTELESLDYRAERDERNKVIGLSDGQRLMLRAGLTKLRRLEHDFLATDKEKYPKMLVVCEDTNVSPYVVEFLKEEGLNDEDVVSIDSNMQGEVSDEEWKNIKAQVFDIDKHPSPKVIVSVLMLREGFDVNNICVLVPLRSSEAPILLEQLIGRGLRLMWREPEYTDIKRDDRQRVLNSRKEPKTYIDMLSVIEHPAFIQFYDDLFNSGLGAVDADDIAKGGSATGDIINVGLKEEFESYDFDWPLILREAEEELEPAEIDINEMDSFKMFTLERLRHFLASDGETFVTQEAVVEHTPFSSVATLRMRENFSLELQKTIYERLPFPSNKGEFEKNFMEFLDRDSGVERFLKINETQHAFAIIYYIRKDGLLATYHPDFIVGTEDRIYLIETKGDNQMDDRNVRLKQTATVEWTRKINDLPAEERMGRQWEYVLLSEDNFYSLSGSGASLKDYL